MRVFPILALLALLPAASASALEMTDELQQAIDCSAAEAVLGVAAKSAAEEDPGRAEVAQQLDKSGQRWLIHAVNLVPDEDSQPVLDAFKARAREFTDSVTSGSHADEMHALIDSCSAAEKEIFGTSYSELE